MIFCKKFSKSWFNNNMKNIDVLMATYNGELYIKEQISSILLNFDNCDGYYFRLLISDDASTDNTVSIINNYCDIDKRVILLDSRRKGGVRENFNLLIRSTEADYVFFCDQDDFWLPNKIKIFTEEFKKIDPNVPTLIHSDLCVADDDLSPISLSMFDYQKLNKSPSLKQIITSNSVTGCVMAGNKKIIDLAKQSNINSSIMHDWYLAIIALAFGNLVFIDKSLILYRQHENNQVGAKNFSILYFLDFRRIKNKIKSIHSSIKLTQKQAEVFLTDFDFKLKSNERQLINDYVESFNSSFYKRALLFFLGFRKKGIIRNVAFFLFYVMLGNDKK